MAETTMERDAPHMTEPAQELNIQSMPSSTSPSLRNVNIEKISPVPKDDLYGSDEEYGEKKRNILADGSVKCKKTKHGFEDGPLEEPGPPPYSPPTAESVTRPLRKTRRLLFIAIGVVCLLIIVLAVSLGVELSKNSKERNGGGGSDSSGTSGSGFPTSNPTSNPSSPTSTTHPGDASHPLRNTAISVITTPGVTIGDPSLVQIFFQDKDYYLCSKSSTSGAELWPLTDSGTRILPALNSTPISAVRGVQASDNFVPIRVFFINAQGYLADVYQSIWGGPWLNGSLSDRQFQVGDQSFGDGSNSISATCCDGAVVHAQGTDQNLYIFQLSGDDTEGNGGTWDIARQISGVGGITATNIATSCVWSSILFINSFDGLEDTGQLVTWFDSTNITVPLPSSVADLYRPDTPISTAYYAGDDRLTLYLFFPLPTSLSSFSPNPSLHFLTAKPYWSSKALMPGCDDCWYATEGRLNWTDSTLVDTGIVPFARGSAALFTEGGVSAGNGVVGTMPRSWAPLLLDGWGDAGRILVVYLDSEMAIRIADVVGGSGNYLIIDGSG